MTGDPTSRRRVPVFLAVACASLAVLVVLLTGQNLALKRQLGERPAMVVDALEAGQPLGSLALLTTPGETRELKFGQGEKRTLLMVFSENCPACQETLPIWSDLARELGDRSGVRTVGVSTDQPGDDDVGRLVLAALPFDVYAIDAAASESMGQIPYIPATIILDDRGIVENVKFGVPNAEDLEDLRESLGS